MPRTMLAAAFAAALLAAGSAAAATVNRYSDLYVFGDSLSDTGNLFALTGGGAPPSPPYAEGRFADGPVWADHLAGDFARRGLVTVNFAHGGATATAAPGSPPVPVPNLDDQIAAFRAGALDRLGSDPVAIIWIGANDFFRRAAADPAPPAVAGRMLAAAGAVTAGVADLAEAGVDSFLVFNLPPLDHIPAFALGSPEGAALAAFATRTFNDALEEGLGGLAATGLDVARFDIEGALDEILAEPGRFGLSNTTFPCYVQSAPPETRCPDSVAAVSVFFDTVHPTAAVHAELARRVRHEVAPIPLPLPAFLLLAGIGGLLLTARRRA